MTHNGFSLYSLLNKGNSYQVLIRPYSFLDEKGKPSGCNVEITQAIAKIMALNVEIQIGSWGDIREALETSKIEAISGMYYSEERDKFDILGKLDLCLFNR